MSINETLQEALKETIIEKNVYRLTQEDIDQYRRPVIFPGGVAFIWESKHPADLPQNLDFEGSYDGREWGPCEFGETEETGWHPVTTQGVDGEEVPIPGVFHAAFNPCRPIMRWFLKDK